MCKTMKLYPIIIAIISWHAALSYGNYDFAGVRDPMVKSLPKKIINKTNIVADATEIANNKKMEILDVLRKCRIEGVVVADDDKLVLINDRLLREGDKISPDHDVCIDKIEYKSIIFSLDGHTVIYSLTVPK